MEIEVLKQPEGDVVGWELLSGKREGRFVLLADGSVVYRNPYDPVAYPSGTLPQFRQAAEAWARYHVGVVGRPEVEQLAAVERLRADLVAAGVLTKDGFWSVIMEQAEDGLL
jgi:hypothetical protein